MAWKPVYENVSSSYEALVRTLEMKNAPVPLVGTDLPDEQGHSCGFIAELMWDTQKVAVVDSESLTGAKGAVASGWLLLGSGELEQSLSSLFDALAERKGSAS